MPYLQKAKPTGAVDGSNVTFTLPPYSAGSVQVVINGIEPDQTDSVYGWTETSPSAGTVTLASAPVAGDTIGRWFYLDTVTATPITGTVTGSGNSATITIVKGQDFTWGPIICRDANRTIMDLTGCVVYWGMKRQKDDDFALLLGKSSLPGQGITINATPSTGRIDSMFLPATDTETLKLGTHHHTLWVVTAGGLKLPVYLDDDRVIVAGRARELP